MIPMSFVRQALWIVLCCSLIACGNQQQTVQRLPSAAAISSADPQATAAGNLILEVGGNAFDAAVAVSAALAVVEPASSGLGGGGFFLLHDAATGRQIFLDARETAPAAAAADMYLDEAGNLLPQATYTGPLAAAIPGLPAGLVHLAQNYGQLPLSVSLAPAIELAETGFVATERMLLGLKFRRTAYDSSPAFKAVFLPDEALPESGDIIRQPDLAGTLRRLADDGFDGFYKGLTARLLVAGVVAHGGIWTDADLANYRVVEREPLVFAYRDVRFVTAPPPSSGGVVLAQMFNILEGYDESGLTSADRAHLTIESMRRAYRDRAEYLGDPDAVDMPLERLTSQQHADELRAGIDMQRATPSSELRPAWSDGSEGNDTTHFSILDASGNRVAATQSINTWYGAAFMPAGTGVILNNEMDDFSTKPGTPNSFGLIGASANAIAPNKRMLSSMSPTFLESADGVAILGTPGGSRIITQIALAAEAWIAGATAQQMVELKRYHQQYLPDNVVYEPDALSPEDFADLEARGHSFSVSRRPYGNMNVVTWRYSDGEVSAATDPRGEGEARVY
jgi:gamma-glutamyltranspeptidase/glutathione hydrolase